MAVTQLGDELKAGKRRVFFYAASGFDWQPLHRFSHLCDCFVYVDPRAKEPVWGCTAVEFEIERRKLEHGQTRAGENLRGIQLLALDEAYRVLTEVVGPLAEMRNESWARIPDLQDRPAWGAVQKLRRRVGGQAKDIWLVYIAGSPLVAYRRLFIETGTAPECLAIPMPEFPEALQNPHGHPPFQQQWVEFAGRDWELGQLLRDNNAPLPRLLVADDIMDWHAHSIHYSISKWRSAWKTNVHKMNNTPWPVLAPATGAGGRRVVLTRKPINPHHARAVGAIVVTSEKYHGCRWPVGVLVLISAPPMYPEYAIPDGPGVVNINIVDFPLLRALADVERVCAEHDITTVAIQGLPGFEDEAADLSWWRQQDGQIKELILHVGCDGHYIDFAPAADVID
jgi:hypothetical protein